MGIGIETADMLVREVLSRKLRDQRVLARYGGLPSAVLGLPGWIARSLYFLLNHTAERSKERGVCCKFCS